MASSRAADVVVVAATVLGVPFSFTLPLFGPTESVPMKTKSAWGNVAMSGWVRVCMMKHWNGWCDEDLTHDILSSIHYYTLACEPLHWISSPSPRPTTTRTTTTTNIITSLATSIVGGVGVKLAVGPTFHDLRFGWSTIVVMQSPILKLNLPLKSSRTGGNPFRIEDYSKPSVENEQQRRKIEEEDDANEHDEDHYLLACALLPSLNNGITSSKARPGSAWAWLGHGRNWRYNERLERK